MKRRVRRPAKMTNDLTRSILPPTYERLIAQLRREYPEYSEEEIKAAVAEVTRQRT